MPYQSLKAYLNKNKDLLVQRIIDLWLQQPDSPYKEFLLKTEEGQRRLKVYVSLYIDALNGNRHTFLKDQSRVGNARAVKGMKLENVINNIPFLMRTLWELLPEILAENELQSPKFLAEMQEITELLFENYQIIAESFVKTREEIINEKVAQFQALMNFTRDILVLNNRKKFARLLLVATAFSPLALARLPGFIHPMDW